MYRRSYPNQIFLKLTIFNTVNCSFKIKLYTSKFTENQIIKELSNLKKQKIYKKNLQLYKIVNM